MNAIFTSANDLAEAITAHFNKSSKVFEYQGYSVSQEEIGATCYYEFNITRPDDQWLASRKLANAAAAVILSDLGINSHVFEIAGLGKAPFKFVGFQSLGADGPDGMRLMASIGGCETFTTPGGTCAYCGTCIINAFDILSADGKRFHVGIDCLKKTGDRGLVNPAKKEESAIRASVLKQKNTVIIEQYGAEYLSAISSIAGVHPNAYLAGQGKTYGDYLAFCYNASGVTKKGAILKKWLKAGKEVVKPVAAPADGASARSKVYVVVGKTFSQPEELELCHNHAGEYGRAGNKLVWLDNRFDENGCEICQGEHEGHYAETGDLWFTSPHA